MKRYSIYILLLTFIYSCSDYDLNTELNEGRVEVNFSLNIDFGSMTSRNSSWDHIYQSALSITFNSTTSEYTKSVSFDPNDLTSFPETTLPYDTYSWSVSNDGNSVVISDRLFIYGDSSESFIVDNASVTLSLGLNTDFALVTVDKDGIDSVTLSQGDITTAAYSNDIYYYAYINSKKEGFMLLVETVEGINGNVEIASPIASTHYKANLTFGGSANIEINLDEFTTDTLNVQMDLPITYPIVSSVSVPVTFNSQIKIENIKILTHENGEITVRCGMLEDGATFIYDEKTFVVAFDNSIASGYTLDSDPNTCACTSKLTNLSLLFEFAPSEIEDITTWDVSNVTDMSGMFRYTNFNQDISNWDLSSVNDVSAMFGDSQFNQDIGNWDVSNVANMDGMFFSTPFNQDIGNWDVSNVTEMGNMFSANVEFNQNLSNWEVTNVTSCEFFVIESFPQEFMPNFTNCTP